MGYPPQDISAERETKNRVNTDKMHGDPKVLKSVRSGTEITVEKVTSA